jgi:hypothetical protein
MPFRRYFPTDTPETYGAPLMAQLLQELQELQENSALLPKLCVPA